MQNLSTPEIALTNWAELIVTDADGDIAGTLGDLVSNAPANLDNARLNDEGIIVEWSGYLLSVDGEATDANGFETLDVDAVNWDGLADALGR